jgi:hypothetical protein
MQFMVIRGGLRVNLCGNSEGFVCLVPLDMVRVDLCGPCPLTDIRVELISVVKILIGHIASHRVIMGVVIARVALQLNMCSIFLHIIIHRV